MQRRNLLAGRFVFEDLPCSTAIIISRLNINIRNRNEWMFDVIYAEPFRALLRIQRHVHWIEWELYSE
jgi:hypothetical protein